MSVSINTLRGRQEDAMLSLVSMVPIAGDIVGKGFKVLRKNPELASTLLTSVHMQNLKSMQDETEGYNRSEEYDQTSYSRDQDGYDPYDRPVGRRPPPPSYEESRRDK